MSADARTVRRLRLRAPSEALARRGALRLEDALRTASLPSGPRLVIVRRLALGRFAADATAQTMALRMEAALHAAAVSPVHGATADAGASAVWFRDALEAHVALALRMARGAPAGEWFWPRALPGWQAGRGATAGLRWLAHSLAQLPEAASALPAWCAELQAAGALPALRAALQAGDGQALLEQLRWTDAVPQRSRRSAVASRDAGPTAWNRQPPPLRDDRDRFLRRMGIVDGIAAAELRQAGATASGQDDASRETFATSIVGTVDHFPPASRPRFEASTRSATESGQDEASESAETIGRGLRGEPAPSPRSAHPTQDQHLAPTAAGGLLFLLPVLTRLGYADWLAANARWQRQGLAQRIFALALGRLRVGADDPAWALSAHSRGARQTPRSFVAPESWAALLGDGGCRIDTASGWIRDASGRLLLAQWRGVRPAFADRWFDIAATLDEPSMRPWTPGERIVEAAAAAWLRACTRWLRRRAGIGLADLVLRRAQLSLSPTHADLHFPLDVMDLRVRRAGLDIDPGWVHWLGRVVAFHYGKLP